MTRGHKCDYKKQIHEELPDEAVAEIIKSLVSTPRFTAMMQQKISKKIDIDAVGQEISGYEKQLRLALSAKDRLLDEIDELDPSEKHYAKRKKDLADRFNKMYDKIEDIEQQLQTAGEKKKSVEAEQLTTQNLYKILLCFDRLYDLMLETMVEEIQVFEERQPNGRRLKSIKFKLPIIEEDLNFGLDGKSNVETVVLLRRG
ncbi:MAG: hypothetical protein E7553_05040 [Ruminococcaceae bacterium]|nr:hypothetical protein [Oscillospiraceae bacterium]